MLDSTDPGAVLALERSVDLEHTLFLVSSKSGGTIETLSHMRYFLERSGGDGSRFVVVTDPGSPLVDTAKELGFRRVFENDPNIGGRYSVLSYFGLVPAALAGVNVEALLSAAQVAEQNSASTGDAGANSGLWLGVVMGELALQGRDKLTFVVPRRSRASASGASSSWRSPPASTARASCRWRTSRWAPRTPTATTACSST